MTFFNVNQLSGDTVRMTQSHPLHLNEQGGPMQAETRSKGGFDRLLLDALNGVNGQQQTSSALSVQMITDPDSVDPHDVSIAMAQANMSLSLTRAVVDRALRAYQDIINIR